MKKNHLISVLGLILLVCFTTGSFEQETIPLNLRTGARPFQYTDGWLLGPPVVAVVKCGSYDLQEVRRAVGEAIGLIGGLGDVIKPKDAVAIKPNLCDNTPAEWGVTTHLNLVIALIEHIRKITESEITIMEGTGASPTIDCFSDMGWKDLEKKGCRLLDLNHPFPHTDFGEYAVPGGGLYFKSLRLNKEIEKADVFISAAKMKMHSSAGITLSMKNQFGVPPRDAYAPEGTSKSMLHGLSRHDISMVINDINATNPINLAMIDGIIGMEGGEGFWIPGAERKALRVIVIGKNAVAVDAVGAFLMGHDPTAEYPSPPFVNCQNYLRIARDLGLGPNDLKEIDIKLGKGIKRLEDAAVYYRTAWANPDITPDFKPVEVKRIKP